MRYSKKEITTKKFCYLIRIYVSQYSHTLVYRFVTMNIKFTVHLHISFEHVLPLHLEVDVKINT